MTNITIDQLLCESQANARAERRKSRKQREDALAEYRRLHPEPSPWRACAIVLPVREATCTCGASYTFPDGDELVKFQHIRTGSYTYVANHPCRLNTSLPRAYLVMRSKLPICQACFTPSPQHCDPTLPLPGVEISKPSEDHQTEMRLYLPTEPPPRHSTECASRKEVG